MSDEMRHKVHCASSLHHSVFDFLHPNPRKIIGSLVRDESVVTNDSLLKFTARPTVHTYRVFPHNSHPAMRGNNKLICLFI